MTLENEELIQLKGGEQMCDDEVDSDVNNNNRVKDCECIYNNSSVITNNNFVGGHCKCLCR
jgi:hypothetical protein